MIEKSGQGMFVSGAVVAIVLGGMVGAGCDRRHEIGTWIPTLDAGPDLTATGGTGGAADGTGGAAGGRGGAATSTRDAAVPEVGPLGATTTWTGYIENAQTAILSETLHMTFATDDAGNVVGTLRFGDEAPPPPATDPNVGYPPGSTSMSIVFQSSTPTAGFSYTLMNGTLVGDRLRFAISYGELWSGWCALQSPPSDRSGGCLPNSASMGSASGGCTITSPTGGMVSVDCVKVMLCGVLMLCACDASGCAVNYHGGPLAVWKSFDMTVAGDRADGSVANTGNVHFKKAP